MRRSPDFLLVEKPLPEDMSVFSCRGSILLSVFALNLFSPQVYGIILWM